MFAPDEVVAGRCGDVCFHIFGTVLYLALVAGMLVGFGGLVLALRSRPVQWKEFAKAVAVVLSMSYLLYFIGTDAIPFAVQGLVYMSLIVGGALVFGLVFFG